MKIREAKKEDLKQITPILEQISKMHYENRPDIFRNKDMSVIEEEAKEIIESNERKMVVAIDNNSKIYGLLIYKIKEVKFHTNLKDYKSLWIEELGVEQNCRKTGIGKMLIDEAEKIAKLLNCKRIELNCWNFNENAINFYEHMGMKVQRKIMDKEIGE